MTGVLEFYNANLESIMQYRDLKTEVFQAFREVGNVIIFCLQLEELLVSIFSVLLNCTTFMYFLESQSQSKSYEFTLFFFTTKGI